MGAKRSLRTISLWRRTEPELGSITYIRRKGLRRMRITVSPFIGTVVTMPTRLGLSHGRSFVRSNREWILSALERKLEYEKKFTIFKPSTRFSTRYHRLEMKPGRGKEPASRISATRILVTYPRGYTADSEEVQTTVRKAIAETLRREAHAYLPGRVAFLARKNGLKYKSLVFRNAKTRWGSCSAEDVISLNIHLLRLPDSLIDYVILHELAHTLEKNHSRKYWRTLERMLPGALRLDKKLRDYNPVIY